MTRQQPQNLFQIFMIPALIAVLSAFGLVSALVGDDLWDLASWLTLALPIAVVLWCMRPRQRT